jgi:type I restriction enzyme S subunit
MADLLSEDRGISVGVMYPGDHDPDGAPLIKVGDLAQNRINPVPAFRVSREKHQAHRRTALEGGELLLSLVGAVGLCCVVPPTMVGWNAARAVAVVRLRDPEESAFVRLALLSPPLQHLMFMWSNTTVQTTLNLKEIRQLPIPWPPVGIRRTIAAILGAIEDKIELNRRMNETLEEMARALFKSWFVDFDPVRAKREGRAPAGMDAETAALFPDSFEDSELGPIPKGWRVSTMEECSRRIAIGPFGSDIKTENFVPCGVPVIRGGNLTQGFVDKGFVFVSDAKADDLRNANAFPGDIVITHRGTLGQVGIIPKMSRFPRYVVSQSQMLLSADPERASDRYLFEYLRSRAGQHALLANTSQTGVPAIARPVSSVKAIRLVRPPIPVVDAFQQLAEALASRETHNDTESCSLAELRDALLPRLLSGELRVKDAERLAEASL